MLNISRKAVAIYSIASLLTSLCTGEARAQPATSNEDAWTVITSEPRFSDAVSLFQYAGMMQYVQTDHFTAFIPTNAAFEKNPEVLPLLMPGRSRAFPDTTLAVEFIRSHAVRDVHPLSEFAGRSQTLTAISGFPINIDGSQHGAYTVTWISVQSKIATAHVTDAPISTANALIYPVDTVVLTDPKDQ